MSQDKIDGNRRKTNLFLVGAAKSGTTALFYHLKSSEQCCFPKEKEQNFFSRGSSNIPGNGPGDREATYQAQSLGEYHSNYAHSNADVRYLCDASVAYLYDDEAPKQIRAYNSEARIIILLRNPVQRAWSHYLHLVRDCRENRPFYDALQLEDERIVSGWEFSWHYQHMSLYSGQVARYLDAFGSSQVKVLLFDDLMANPGAVMHDLADFLSLKLMLPRGQLAVHNASGALRSHTIARIFNRPTRLRTAVKRVVPRQFGHAVADTIRSLNTKNEKPMMPVEARCFLEDRFFLDNRRLSDLLGRDLSCWISR